MSDPFKDGDNLKEKYLEQALHANDEAVSGAKFTDLLNKDSAVYKDEEKPKEPKPEPKIELPKVDEEGYPIIEQVHTYKEDLAGVVNRDKLSLSRIAMMEGTANKGVPKTDAPAQKKSNLFLIISIALIIMSVGIIGGVLTLVANKNSAANQAPVQAAPQKYIIFSESKGNLNIKSTRSEIAGQMDGLIGGFKEENSVMEAVVRVGNASTSDEASLEDLLSVTEARLPDSLRRTLVSKFFLGIHSIKGFSYPFLLIGADSYDIAYPGLLSWEGLMPSDLSWLFPLPQKIGTSTPTLSFKDRIIANLNARSYEDEQGKTVFFYVFLDDHKILFARTADTLRMVQDRLRQAKFQ